MRTVIAIPPMPRMTGGIAVLYQVAARLRECGHDVALTGQPDAPGLAAMPDAGFTVLPWDAVAGKSGGPLLRPEDTFLVAEGWPNMTAPGLSAKSRVVVYVQNWAYLFSALPDGVAWRDLPVSFLAVSDPVARFMEDTGKLPVSGIVRPMIDTALFHPREAVNGKALRIGWMPRKNKALAEQIRRITEASLHGERIRLHWVEIHSMSREAVAEALASCEIYLATGFPEGCSLPPLEAMASGCLVVGFSGFGSWDYMRNADPAGYAPRIALRPVPWGGNGLFASDGDVVEAAYLLRRAIVMVREDAAAYRAIRENALKTAAAYTLEAQREEVRAAWATLARTRHE